MRHAGLRGAVGVLALCVGMAVLFLSEPETADAAGEATDTESTSVTCRAPIAAGVVTEDGGPTKITCGDGFRAISCETESTTPGYFCGQTGCTSANYTTVGKKRCVGCNNGSAYTINSNQRNADGTLNKCFGTVDAGVVFACTCAR